MFQYILLVVVGVSFIEHALGLECYITDIDSLRNKVIENSAQDCDKYINNAAQKFGIPNLGISLPNNCYTMKVTTDNPNTDFTVRGCVPFGLCDFFVKPIVTKEALQKGVTVRSTTCNLCATPKCNV